MVDKELNQAAVLCPAKMEALVDMEPLMVVTLAETVEKVATVIFYPHPEVWLDIVECPVVHKMVQGWVVL